MNSLAYCQLLSASVLVLILVHSTSGKTNQCVFDCARALFKCKRDRDTSGIIPADTDCCGQFQSCYMSCGMDYTATPSCNNKGKRGSWNKRVLRGPVLPRANRIPSPPALPAAPLSSQYVLPPRQDSLRDSLGFILDNWRDME